METASAMTSIVVKPCDTTNPVMSAWEARIYVFQGYKEKGGCVTIIHISENIRELQKLILLHNIRNRQSDVVCSQILDSRVGYFAVFAKFMDSKHIKW